MGSTFGGEIEQLRERIAEQEGALRALQDLAHGQRMDAIARLAENLAQEFSELSSSLTTQVTLALARLAPGVPGREHVRELEDSGKRAGELARRLRDIGSRAATVELVELNDVIERFVALVRRAMPANVALEFFPGESLPSLTADPTLLEQVLLNLCVNARDALPQGGRIAIETENVIVGAGYDGHHASVGAGSYVLLSVTDDGVGMPPEVRERAFEPFFTTKCPGKGLGLSSVYGIVRSHRGTIHVQSELRQGTTIRIYLPAVDRRPDGGPANLRSEPKPVETILVVEDEEDARRLVCRLLVRAGYRVVAVRDGVEAIRAFSDHLDDVSLVLMDLNLPELGGVEAADRIRILDPRARILFASGASSRGVAQRSDRGPFLSKPYEPERLLQTIRRVLDGRAI